MGKNDRQNWILIMTRPTMLLASLLIGLFVSALVWGVWWTYRHMGLGLAVVVALPTVLCVLRMLGQSHRH